MRTSKFEELFQLHSQAATLEGFVYGIVDRLTKSVEKPYRGGQWLSKPIGAGWYFELQGEREWHVVNENNYSDVVANTKVLSLAACSIAFSEFSWYLTDKFRDDDRVDALLDEVIELHGNMMCSASEYLSDEEMATFSKIVD